jgi:hypothetical protein
MALAYKIVGEDHRSIAQRPWPELEYVVGEEVVDPGHYGINACTSRDDPLLARYAAGRGKPRLGSRLLTLEYEDEDKSERWSSERLVILRRAKVVASEPIS